MDAVARSNYDFCSTLSRISSHKPPHSTILADSERTRRAVSNGPQDHRLRTTETRDPCQRGFWGVYLMVRENLFRVSLVHPTPFCSFSFRVSNQRRGLAS